MPDSYACHDLRWEPGRYDAALQSRIKAEMVDHDAANQVVLIERWFSHNPSMNKSHYKGILDQLERVSSDRLCAKAYDALDAAEKGIDERNTDGGTQPPEKSGAHPAPSDGVTDALMNTRYLTGARKP